MKIQCPYCGQKNNGNSAYCGYCGHALPEPEQNSCEKTDSFIESNKGIDGKNSALINVKIKIKHTQTPWRINMFFGTVVGDDGSLVCTIPALGESLDANIRLIANSPGTLSAMKDLVSCASGKVVHSDSKDHDDDLKMCIYNAREAIEMAEGGAK